MPTKPSRTRKPTAKAAVAGGSHTAAVARRVAQQKKSRAASKTTRDKAAAAERAAQRARENTSDLADEDSDEEEGSGEVADGLEAAQGDESDPWTSSPVENADSDVEEVGSRPVAPSPPGVLGKVQLTSNIKIVGFKQSRGPSRVPQPEKNSKELTNGNEIGSIKFIQNELLRSTRERIEAQFDEEDVTITLRDVYLEAGQYGRRGNTVLWCGPSKKRSGRPDGEFDYVNMVEVLLNSEGPFFLTFTHTYRVTVPAVQATPTSRSTPNRQAVEIFTMPHVGRVVDSPEDNLPSIRRVRSVDSPRDSPSPREPSGGSITARMLTAMNEDHSLEWRAQKQLMERWKCDLGTNCKANRRHRNKADSLQQWCFVMKDRTHVSLSDADLRVWAKAVVDDEAGLRGPPGDLLIKWKQALDDEKTDEEPAADGVSLVRPRKKQKKALNQRESGISVVVNPSVNIHIPSGGYGQAQPAMGPPSLPPAPWASHGPEGLPALPAPPATATTAPGSPQWRRQLPVMSSSPPRVDGDQKALYKEFVLEALRQHFKSPRERDQLKRLPKVMKKEGVDLRGLHGKEDSWFNQHDLYEISVIRTLVKPYLKGKEDLSGLFESDDDEEDLPRQQSPSDSQLDDRQAAIESTYSKKPSR